MTRRLLLAPAAATLLLAGCAHSPPTTVLTLDAAPPAAAAAVRAGYRGPPLAVPAVRVPAALDRAEFVRQAGAGVVAVDDLARWAAPLGLLARDALVRDLAARLPEGAVLPPGTAATPAARTASVTILSFDAGAAGARMEVAYRLLPGGPPRQIALSTSAGGSGGTGGGPVAAAQAFAALLGQLADRIAAELPG